MSNFALYIIKGISFDSASQNTSHLLCILRESFHFIVRLWDFSSIPWRVPTQIFWRVNEPRLWNWAPILFQPYDFAQLVRIGNLIFFTA